MFERVMCAILGTLCVLDGYVLFITGSHGVMFAQFGDALYTIGGVFCIMMAGTFFFMAIYYYRK